MKRNGADDEFIDKAILAAKRDNQINASHK